jgi:hypothetical protein
MRPLRLSPWLFLAAGGCFALAVLLFVYRLIAALLVAGVLVVIGVGLLGAAVSVWRLESRLRGPGPRDAAAGGAMKEADARWRDEEPPARTP